MNTSRTVRLTFCAPFNLSYTMKQLGKNTNARHRVHHIVYGLMGLLLLTPSVVWAQGANERQVYTETYTYDAANRLTNVAYSTGYQIEYAYDANSNPLSRTVIEVDVTSLEGDEVPGTFALEANYPNPFNPSTVIRYQLPQAVQVRIDVFNVLGQRVRTLVAAEQAAGRYEVVWNGLDEGQQPTASGVYLYRMQAGSFIETRTMLLVK